MSTQTKTNLTSVISFLWEIVKLQKFRFCAMFILTLGWTLDATIWPYLLRSIIDLFGVHDAHRASAWPFLYPLLIWTALLWLFVEASFQIRRFLQAKTFPEMEASIRLRMFDHVQHHSPKYFSSHFSGELANKINDLPTQATVFFESLTVFFPTIVTTIVSMVLFFQIQPLFAGILAIWVALQCSVFCIFGRKCAAYSESHGAARSELAGKVVDSLANYFAVNLFSRFSFEKKRILKSQKKEQEKHYKARSYSVLVFTNCSILFVLGSLAMTTFMVFYWMQDKISTGEVVQIFNTTWNVLLAFWFFTESVPPFLQSIGIISQAQAILSDPQDVLDAPGAKPLSIKSGEIIFENVSFRYGEKQIFENKNIRIKGGEKIGLVGKSGAGKSTFANLILRFYPIEGGKILIDGQDIAHVTRDSLRKEVTLVPQDTPLFHRSLAENLLYGNIDSTEEEMRQAAKAAHCEEFISRFPEGYDTIVGERGAKLSGGERQRMSIARAFLSKAPIIILDEATSALDSITESYIQESLKTLMEGKTTIVIAHRLSTLAQMDRILVFHLGKIVEEGTHQELLALQGRYAKMWNKQAGGFLPS